MKKEIKLIIIFLGLIFSLTVAAYAAEINMSEAFPEALRTLESGTGNIGDYLKNLYLFALGIAGVAAAGMITVGAIYWSTSGGSPDRQREGKEYIMSAIWGVALLFGSYLILNTINPQLTAFKTTAGLPKTPTSTITTGPIRNGCGDFKTTAYRSVYYNLADKCDVRITTSTGNFTIGQGFTPARGIYVNLPDETIKTGGKVWQYPFSVKVDGKWGVNCLIYAYQNPNNSKPTVLKFNFDTSEVGVTPCD